MTTFKYDSLKFMQNTERYSDREQAISRMDYLRQGTWKNTRIEVVIDDNGVFHYLVKKFA